MVDFLVIGPESVMGYNNIFPLIKDRRFFMGYKRDRGHMLFNKNDEIADVPNIRWFQNLIEIDVPELELNKKYTDYYKKYDDFDAINIDKKEDIPDNYYGLMGVPVSVLMYINRNQFELLGVAHSGVQKYDLFTPYIDGKFKFSRWIIRRRKDG